MQRTFQLWLDDKPGALLRVAGIVTATGCNITSLNVAPDAFQSGISRMTLVADLDPHLIHRVLAKMNRLIDVHSALDITGESRGSRPATRHPQAQSAGQVA